MHFIQLTFSNSEFKVLINVEKISRISQHQGTGEKDIKTLLESEGELIMINEDYETVVAMLDQLRHQDVHVTKKVYTPRTPNAFENLPGN
jgi:hypothetical protein